MRDVITVGSPAEAAERRTKLIDYVWKGSGLPAALPQTDVGVEPPELAELVRSRIDRLTVRLAHGLTSTSYLAWPTGRHNGRFVVYHGGHGDPHGEQHGPATRRAAQTLLDNGYLVAVVDLPLHGWNRHAQLTGHADFAAYESSEFSGLTFFLEPLAQILNQVERNHQPASIGLVGFSGGAWATTVYAAIDPRVTASYPVAGTWPFFLRSQPAHSPNVGDWEQRADALPGFYAIAGYLDLYVLGATGRGRRQLQVLNRHDPSCFPGLGDRYASDVERHVRELGQGSWALLDDATHREHTVSPYALSVILDDLHRYQNARTYRSERMSVRGPAVPTATSRAVHHPLGLADVRLTGGLLAQLRQVNRTASLPMGIEQLEAAGNYDNLKLAAGQGEGEYRGPVYMDSDVTKLMETAAWELASAPDQALEAFLAEATELLENAQQKDGYLHSHNQVKTPGERYTNLSGSHELYCAGHLMQAAVAAHRSIGDDRLLDVARRFADHLVEEFLDGPNTSLDGHPEVETALVELYRDTGDGRYLRLATKFVDERGKGLVGTTAKGPENYQDHLPVRDAPTLLGHAVRALYLEAGVVDVYLETGDESLLRASVARWDDMVATKTAITGGQGSRLLREAFGDRYELPPDLAFNETCTAVASIHWAWRLLLATGQARYADLIERTVYNGFAAATSLDGQRFFKGNPLQRRADHFPFEHEARRSGWFWSACCPPNVTRLLASLPGYVATTAADTLYVHQFAAGTMSAGLASGALELDVETDYPWAGEITFTVREAPESRCGLALRVPSWSRQTRVFAGDTEHENRPDEHGYVVIRRRWRAGETVRLGLDLRPRLTYPGRRLDAVRGCVAIERGPLVYCVEQVDQPAGVNIDDLTVPATCEPRAVELADDPQLGRTVVLDVDLDLHTEPAAAGLPYTTVPSPASVRTVTARAVPYFRWDNRDGGAMRVWLPARA